MFNNSPNSISTHKQYYLLKKDDYMNKKRKKKCQIIWEAQYYFSTKLMHMKRNVKKSYATILNYNFQKLSEAKGVAEHARFTWLITHLSRDITCTDHVALMH